MNALFEGELPGDDPAGFVDERYVILTDGLKSHICASQSATIAVQDMVDPLVHQSISTTRTLPFTSHTKTHQNPLLTRLFSPNNEPITRVRLRKLEHIGSDKRPEGVSDRSAKASTFAQ